jgi:hypothetical protein
MKPLPSPHVAGRTPAERMDNALRTILRVPKDAILKAEAKEKRKREKKKAMKEQKQK